MAVPATRGSVLAQFEAILGAAIPELTGDVQAVAFDVHTGRLHVAPDAPAVGTTLRWNAPKLSTAADRTVPEAIRPRPASWRPHP